MRNLQITSWRGTKTTFSKESRQVKMEEKKYITAQNNLHDIVLQNRNSTFFF